jgi:hypothetical protein
LELDALIVANAGRRGDEGPRNSPAAAMTLLDCLEDPR